MTDSLPETKSLQVAHFQTVIETTFIVLDAHAQNVVQQQPRRVTLDSLSPQAFEQARQALLQAWQQLQASAPRVLLATPEPPPAEVPTEAEPAAASRLPALNGKS